MGEQATKGEEEGEKERRYLYHCSNGLRVASRRLQDPQSSPPDFVSLLSFAPRDPRLTIRACIACPTGGDCVLRNQEHFVQERHHLLPSHQVAGHFDQQLKEEDDRQTPG